MENNTSSIELGKFDDVKNFVLYIVHKAIIVADSHYQISTYKTKL